MQKMSRFLNCKNWLNFFHDLGGGGGGGRLTPFLFRNGITNQVRGVPIDGQSPRTGLVCVFGYG